MGRKKAGEERGEGRQVTEKRERWGRSGQGTGGRRRPRRALYSVLGTLGCFS